MPIRARFCPGVHQGNVNRVSVERVPESEPASDELIAASPAEPEAAHAAPAPAGSGWRRQLRRPYVWLGLAFLVALGVWWFAIRSDGTSTTATAAPAQQLVTVTRGTMSTPVSAEGTVAAAQTDDLSFSSSGTVTAVNVKAGDTVTAGQVLATIDSSQLQASLSSAHVTVASAQAKLSDDQAAGASDAQISADETTLASANDALTSAQQALDGASLVATFDGTVSQVNITVGQQLSNGGTGATSATGSGSGSGRSSSTLGSGNNGFGGGSNSSANSSSSSPQVEVVTRGSYTVSLPVSSNDIANVAPGQSVTLTVTTSSANGPGGFGGRFGGFGGFGGFGRAAGGNATGTGNGGTGNTTQPSANGATGPTATGTVTDVAKVATATSGVATYPVTVTFTAPASDFYIGATVSGSIATSVRPNVLQVPILAVTNTNGTSTVTVATKGTLAGPHVTRTVKTGSIANGMIEITSGLREGESVVYTVPTFTRPTGGTGTGTGGQFTNGGGFRGGFGGGGTGGRTTTDNGQ